MRKLMLIAMLSATLSAQAGFAPPEPLEPPPGWRMQDLGTRLEAWIIAIAEQWWG